MQTSNGAFASYRRALFSVSFLVVPCLISSQYRISPIPENALHMPDWFFPSPSQCAAAHPIYIDTVPWPAMRNGLIDTHQSYSWTSYLASFCENLNVNWTEDVRKTYVIGNNGATTLSPAFVSHLRNLKNWTMKKPFAEQFPDLARLTSA